MKASVLAAASIAAFLSFGGMAQAQQNTVTGAAGGAVTGAIVGGPVGAVVGGAIGGTVGAAADAEQNRPVVVQPAPTERSRTCVTEADGSTRCREVVR